VFNATFNYFSYIEKNNIYDFVYIKKIFIDKNSFIIITYFPRVCLIESMSILFYN